MNNEDEYYCAYSAGEKDNKQQLEAAKQRELELTKTANDLKILLRDARIAINKLTIQKLGQQDTIDKLTTKLIETRPQH